MNKHTKIYVILIVLILFLNGCILLKRSGYQKWYDDILFLKFLKQEEEQTQLIEKADVKQYIFKVDCKNVDFRNIDLLETVNNQTLVNEKIAPGVEGNFQIVLEANEDINYFITFESNNVKPKNLKFENIETQEQKECLEDFGSELKGRISKNEKKVITIHWFWQYENTEEENMQDTIDSQNIRDYEFTIYANGQSTI